jgi:hypothetical protein
VIDRFSAARQSLAATQDGHVTKYEQARPQVTGVNRLLVTALA